MSTKIYRCTSGLEEIHLEVYGDGSGFAIDLLETIGESKQLGSVILGRNDAKAIINQLQEYLDETSESTPA